MKSEVFLLDSSALITLLANEPGAQRVEQVLARAENLIPWTTLLEVYYIARRERGEAEADILYALVKRLPVMILWDMDESILLTAARITSDYRCSFADALISAYAIQYQAVLLPKDPEFEQLRGEIQMEFLPYKK
jgi:predicted nucleic acid-binding protein